MSQENRESELARAEATLAAAKHVHEEQTTLHGEACDRLERAEGDLTEARLKVLKLSGWLAKVEWSLQIMLDVSNNPIAGLSRLIPFAVDSKSVFQVQQSISELFCFGFHDGVCLSGYGTPWAVALNFDDGDLIISVPDGQVVEFAKEWQLTIRLMNHDLDLTIAKIRERLATLEGIKAHFLNVQSKLG